MSPYTRTTRRGQVRPSRYQAVQWPMVLWLTLVWTVLWGTYSPLSVVGGVVVGVLVSFVFPLPPLRMQVRVRPWPLLVLLGVFLRDVLVASIEVARITLVPPKPLRNAMVQVPLRTESDIVLAVVAELVSLVPGTLVIEAHRPSHTLFLHVIDVRDPGKADRVRAQVWAQEARVVRAFGVDTSPVSETEEVAS